MVLLEGSGLYVRTPDELIEKPRSALDFWQVVRDRQLAVAKRDWGQRPGA